MSKSFDQLKEEAEKQIDQVTMVLGNPDYQPEHQFEAAHNAISSVGEVLKASLHFG